MNKFYITVAALLISLLSEMALADATNDTLLLAGKKDDVLSVVRKSLISAFPSGNLSDGNGYIGYWMAFRSHWTGWHNIFVSLEPMTTENSFEATAYRIKFSYKMEKTFANGTQDIKELTDKITEQAPQSNVAVVQNSPSYKTLSESRDICFSKLKDDPEIQALSEKTALSNAKDTTLIMLADESKPTQVEKGYILKWSAKRDKCNSLFVAYTNFFPTAPGISEVFENIALVNKSLLGLYKGELSFGEFNQQRQALLVDSQKKFTELNKNLSNEQQKNAELERQHQLQQQQVNIQQQKANDEATAAAIQAFKPVQVQTPPTIQPPATINCTSRAIGNTVSTNCN